MKPVGVLAVLAASRIWGFTFAAIGTGVVGPGEEPTWEKVVGGAVVPLGAAVVQLRRPAPAAT